MSDGPKTTYLPNLVGGVSMWKLAHDLNEAKFMDGRLLVPETEGSDSLPVTVRWKLEGLVPLREARARFPEAEAAVTDFVACVKRVEAELGDAKSGYAKYKEAFTLPAIDGDGDAYFFDPTSKKLAVINWGASPRTIGGKEEFVFGYGSFDKLFAAAAVAAAAAAPSVVAAPAPAAPAPSEPAKPEEKKPDEKKEPKPGALLWGKPWWVWLLVALGVAALLLLLLFLLRACEAAPDSRADASPDVVKADASGEDASRTEGTSSSSGGVSTQEKSSSSSSGGVSTQEKSSSSSSGGVSTQEKSSSSSSGGVSTQENGDTNPAKEGVSAPGGEGDVSGGPGGIGGKIIVVPGGPLVPVASLPHRAHFHPDALKWKVASGEQFLAAGSPREGNGKGFDVYLKPGNTFEQVTVLWQDKRGIWHQ